MKKSYKEQVLDDIVDYTRRSSKPTLEGLNRLLKRRGYDTRERKLSNAFWRLVGEGVLRLRIVKKGQRAG